jgi:hypothetical protein
MTYNKISKKASAISYVPFMGTLSEQLIATGMQRFVETVKFEQEKAKMLEAKKSPNTSHH